MAASGDCSIRSFCPFVPVCAITHTCWRQHAANVTPCYAHTGPGPSEDEGGNDDGYISEDGIGDDLEIDGYEPVSRPEKDVKRLQQLMTRTTTTTTKR